MATACSITDAGDEDGEKALDSSSKSRKQLKRKRTAAVVAPPLPPLSVAYRVALDGAICAALVAHLVRFLLYFRGQIP